MSAVTERFSSLLPSSTDAIPRGGVLRGALDTAVGSAYKGLTYGQESVHRIAAAGPAAREWVAERRTPKKHLPLRTLDIAGGAPTTYTDESPKHLSSEIPVFVFSGMEGERPEAIVDVLHGEGRRVIWIADTYQGRTQAITERSITAEAALQHAHLIEHITQQEDLPYVDGIGYSWGGNVLTRVGKIFDTESAEKTGQTPTWRSSFSRVAGLLAPSSALADSFNELRQGSEDNPQRLRSLTVMHSPGLLVEEARSIPALANRFKGRPPTENRDGLEYFVTHPIKGGRQLYAISRGTNVEDLTEFADNGIPVATTAGLDDELVPSHLVDPRTPNLTIVSGNHYAFVSDRGRVGEYLENVLSVAEQVTNT